MKLGCLVLLLLLSACSVKKKNLINSAPSGAPIVPMSGNPGSPYKGEPYAGYGPSSSSNVYLNAPVSALSGKIYFKAQMPFPVSNVQLRLIKITNNKSENILDFNTNRDGFFEITRPLEKGDYQLLVVDPRYKGDFKIPLNDGPLRDLIFEVEKK